MENYCSSYPDSRSSSPRSHQVDTDNRSWDEPLATNTAVPTGSATPATNINFKVKLMCSYGGKIQPRPHDNQLAYIGGDTKILAVDRHIKFAALMAKLSCFSDADVYLKYQLPGEDLDALISVTNDEDLVHMMVEYDRLYRASAKPARLRLFLFPFNSSAQTSFSSVETKAEWQLFVEALNSVQILPQDGFLQAPVSAGNPDFLFGLDKGYSAVPVSKLIESAPLPAVHEVTGKDFPAGSDCGSEDRHGVEQVVSQGETQKQIQQLQKLQSASNEQNVQRRSDEAIVNGNSRAYSADYYSQENPERVATPPAPVQVQMPAATYLPERHMTTSGYPVTTAAGTDQPVYLVPTQAGMFQAMALKPVTNPVSQPYYGMPRMVPTEMSNAAPPSLSHSQAKVGVYKENIETGQQRVGVAETCFLVGYDNAGRQVYYMASPVGFMPQYQVMSAGIDGRQGGNLVGGASNSEGKVVVNKKASQTTAV